MMLSASSYLKSYMSSRIVPAVDVMKIIGCSLAVMPSATMSYSARPFCHWWISSIRAQCTFRPSRLLLSLASGLKVPSFSSKASSPTRGRIRFDRLGDFLIIRFASFQMIFAWSLFVATA